VRDWTDVTKEVLEDIFCECDEVYTEYKDVCGSSYLKIICLIKEEWIDLLDKLNELSGIDSHVWYFAKKVRENLKSLSEEECYVSFYVGETCQKFGKRMRGNYPDEFLTPFPATHVIKLIQVKDGISKDRCKYAMYAMEAFIAVWFESKLGDVSHFSGHFLNKDQCGYRSFYGYFGRENKTYVSYEIQPVGTYKPLVVHPTWHHMRETYGGKNAQIQALQHDSFVAHPRYETVFLHRFSTYSDTDEIQHLFEDAREAMGDARAKELRKVADLKSAYRGLYVSKTGKLPDTGGIKGTDYEEYISTRQAFCHGPLPSSTKQDGKVRSYNYS
jgi:hypothetical protein